MRKLDEKGNAAIILCLTMAAIFAVCAYSIDIGIVFVERTRLSNAIDAAALAGAYELPNDIESARAKAVEYLNKNGIDENKAQVIVNDTGVEINASKNIEHIFAPIMGINSSTVKENTKAVIGPLKSVSTGIRPFAVEYFDFTYGQQIILKENAGDAYKGNYGAVALGGSGASVYEDNALYGYKGKISVGDYIDTEPGEVAGVSNSIKNYINSEQSTFDDFPRDSIRLWTLPLVDSFQVNGKGQLLVSGFGEFYVEDITKRSSKIEITGRFVRYVKSGEIDNTLRDSGAYAAKLSQ